MKLPNFIRTSRFWAALIAMSLVAVYSLIPNALYAVVEHGFYDQLILLSPKIKREQRIVLVDIDEQSLAAVGAWPWSRQTMSQLLQQLTEHYRVALLGVDIVFPEHKDGDAALKQALQSPRLILGQVLDFAQPSENQVGQLADLIPAPFASTAIAAGYIANHPALLSDQIQAGHISPTLDSDGKVRRVYPIACMTQTCTLALSLRMYQVLNGGDRQLSLVMLADAMRLPLNTADYLDLPLDAEQALLIPFRVASFEYITASEVLNGRVALSQLENRLVILGSTALGLGDHVATAIDNLTPGMEIHAQLLASALDRRFIQPVALSAPRLFGASLLIALLFWIWRWHAPRGQILWMGSMLLISIGLNVSLFNAGYWLPFSVLPLNIVLIALLSLLFESARLDRQISGIANQFSRFLPASIVKLILTERDIAPASERRVLTVLIADMRGFTAASEGKPPEAVAELAQRCLETLSEIVYRHNGTIEKYTGDGLMALWGAALTDTSHAQQAVQAGIAMQQAVALLAPWFIDKGFQPLKVSVGINTGEMAVGIFGGASHLAWTAQGDAFNTASRIEQLTRTVGADLLIGAKTAQLIGMSQVVSQGSYQVKGLSLPIEIFALSGRV